MTISRGGFSEPWSHFAPIGESLRASRQSNKRSAAEGGGPISYGALRREFKQLLGIAKLPGSIRPYDLRHSFVTFSLIAGVDAKTVSAEVGHASVGFTLDRLSSVLEEMRENASDRREELLKSRAIN